MTLIKFKEFLNCGAILQTAPDTFNLVMGPFTSTTLSLSELTPDQTVLYQPHFWDFSVSKPSSTFLVGQKSFSLTRYELIDLLEQCEHQEIKVDWEKPTVAEFKVQFDWSKKKFEAKELTKTVPIISQSGKVKFGLAQLCESLLKLAYEHHNGWTYGSWQNGKGFLGHTPEQIAHWELQTQELQTSAIAGTSLNIEGAADLLVRDQKNLVEHQIVVDDITQKIKSINFVDNLQVGQIKALELKHLVHLKTEFKMQVSQAEEAFGVVSKLHPTAALGIYPPNQKNFEEFKSLQSTFERASFAAPFGIIQPHFLFVIASIRSYFFNSETIKIYSGCGVTSQSVYENELTELANKRESVKKMMGLQS